MPSDDTKSKINNSAVIEKYIYKGAPILVYGRLGQELQIKRTVIFDVTSDYFLVPRPFLENPLIKIEKGMNILLRVIPKDGYYIEFSEKIIDSNLKINGKLFISIKFPDEIIRVQRRDTYRIPVSIPGQLIQEENSDNQLSSDIIIHDISLGGALIATNSNIKPEKNCTLIFQIDVDSVKINCEVEARLVRLSKITSLKSKFLFHCGLQFIRMNEELNRKLYRFITLVQLSERAKLNQ